MGADTYHEYDISGSGRLANGTAMNGGIHADQYCCKVTGGFADTKVCFHSKTHSEYHNGL